MTKHVDDAPEFNPFASRPDGMMDTYVAPESTAAIGRAFADHGHDLPIRLGDMAVDAVEKEEGNKLTGSQRKAVVDAVAGVVTEKKKFPTVREFFVGLCNAVSGACKKLGLDKALSWFKDLGEAVTRGMSVKAIRAARDAGESAKGASAHVSAAKPTGNPSRSV